MSANGLSRRLDRIAPRDCPAPRQCLLCEDDDGNPVEPDLSKYPACPNCGEQHVIFVRIVEEVVETPEPDAVVGGTP
jgi:hypothetical protein